MHVVFYTLKLIKILRNNTLHVIAFHQMVTRGRCWHDRLVVGFITCAISAYHL